MRPEIAKDMAVNQPKVPGRGGKNKGFTTQLQSRKESMYTFKIFKVFY